MRTSRRGQPEKTPEEDRARTNFLPALRARWIEGHRKAYERRKNPVFLWHVYLLCRRTGLSLPPWVLEYFDGVAQTFDAWATGKTPMPESRALPVAVAKTLGMRRLGAGNVFREYLHQWKDTEAWLAQRVYDQVRDGHKLSFAQERVAKECGVSTGKVRRACGKYKDWFEVEDAVLGPTPHAK